MTMKTGGYLERVRFLVVEDYQFARRVLKEILRHLGATDVTFVKDGAEAWEHIKRDMPDIVLLDWEMAPVDGLFFLQSVRHDPRSPNPHLPIIMVTGYADRQHVFTARDAGVNEYVIKPISAKALLDRIQAVIERPRRFVRIGNFFGPDRRRLEKKFLGPDKRGLEEVAATPKIPATAEMRQEEINALFNPDDVPEPPSASAKKKVDEPDLNAPDRKS